MSGCTQHRSFYSWWKKKWVCNSRTGSDRKALLLHSDKFALPSCIAQSFALWNGSTILHLQYMKAGAAQYATSTLGHFVSHHPNFHPVHHLHQTPNALFVAPRSVFRKTVTNFFLCCVHLRSKALLLRMWVQFFFMFVLLHNFMQEHLIVYFYVLAQFVAFLELGADSG